MKIVAFLFGSYNIIPYICLMEETIDLFENYDELPYIVKQILESADEMKDTYAENERMIKELAPLRYTFDYGLSGEPMELKRIYNEDLRKLVLNLKYVNVVTTGLDMDCEEVICYGVLWHDGDDFVYRDGDDGIDCLCNDNIWDYHLRTPENVEKVKESLKKI